MSRNSEIVDSIGANEELYAIIHKEQRSEKEHFVY